jgi:hypothetical protein
MNAPSATRIEAATEDFYGLLPAHIRTVDAGNGYPLKALIAVLAGGAAEIDGEIDTLLDSLFVDTAPEGGLADFAALVAAEPLRPLPEGAGHNARAYIANTLLYRRGKGTARVLEALAADVGGFGAVAVEYFMRLARTQHLIDLRPERPATADLVAGETAARTATAFDRLPRLVDVRSIARAAGRHHVPNVGVHLLRPIVPAFPAPPGDGLAAADMNGVPVARPWLNGTTLVPGYFQLAAQPGDILRLFNPDRRAESGGGRVIETDLRDRLKRLPLHLETEERRRAGLEGRPPRLGETPWFDDAGQPFTLFVRTAAAGALFERVRPEQILIANLEAMPTPTARPAAAKAYKWFTNNAGGGAPPLQPDAHNANAKIRCGFDPVTGRLITAPPVAPAKEIVEVRIAYAYGIGREIGAGPQDRNDDDVPFDILDTAELQHFVRIVDATAPAIVGPGIAVVATLAQALADWKGLIPIAPAGSRGRRGLIVLARCDRETGAGSPAVFPVFVHPGTELHIVSGQWRKPKAGPGIVVNPERLGYVVRKDRRFTADGRVRVMASAAPPLGGRPGVLILDGLEITAGVSLAAGALSQLSVRHCTLRAPGAAALETTAALRQADIRIDRSIVGRIRLDFGAGPAVGTLAISGSLVSADGFGGDAIAAATIDASLKDVTIFGPSAFKSLEATNVIFAGPALVTRRQIGCVRYSAIAPASKMPRRFRCEPDLAVQAAEARKGAPLTAAERSATVLGVTPIFLDTGLGEPTVAMLHPLTSAAIASGGEGDCEMGVFAASAERLRMSNIESLFDDYVPFGLEAGLIDDTRSTAVAQRRNRP